MSYPKPMNTEPRIKLGKYLGVIIIILFVLSQNWEIWLRWIH